MSVLDANCISQLPNKRTHLVRGKSQLGETHSCTSTETCRVTHCCGFSECCSVDVSTGTQAHTSGLFAWLVLPKILRIFTTAHNCRPRERIFVRSIIQNKLYCGIWLPDPTARPTRSRVVVSNACSDCPPEWSLMANSFRGRTLVRLLRPLKARARLCSCRELC